MYKPRRRYMEVDYTSPRRISAGPELEFKISAQVVLTDGPIPRIALSWLN